MPTTGITRTLHTLLHPLAFVTVTEYTPMLLTEIHRVVAPVLHKYAAFVGTQSWMDCPILRGAFPVMMQDDGLPQTSVLVQRLVQPLAFVTVTQYIPALLTEIQRVVSPVVHS